MNKIHSGSEQKQIRFFLLRFKSNNHRISELNHKFAIRVYLSIQNCQSVSSHKSNHSNILWYTLDVLSEVCLNGI